MDSKSLIDIKISIELVIDKVKEMLTNIEIGILIQKTVIRIKWMINLLNKNMRNPDQHQNHVNINTVVIYSNKA